MIELAVEIEGQLPAGIGAGAIRSRTIILWRSLEQTRRARIVRDLGNGEYLAHLLAGHGIGYEMGPGQCTGCRRVFMNAPLGGTHNRIVTHLAVTLCQNRSVVVAPGNRTYCGWLQDMRYETP